MLNPINRNCKRKLVAAALVLTCCLCIATRLTRAAAGSTQPPRKPQHLTSAQPVDAQNQQQPPDGYSGSARVARQQQQQQQQPTRQLNQHSSSLLEISCDELNLIVSEQPERNFSAQVVSRFIECQHIDPSAASKRFNGTANSSSSTQVNSAADWSSQQLQRPTSSSRSNSTSSGSSSSSSSSSASSSSSQPALKRQSSTEFNVGSHNNNYTQSADSETHFGAKVALSVLIATVLLVLSATLVDLNNTEIQHTKQQSLDDNNLDISHLSNAAHVRSANTRSNNSKQEHLRDQRSPSLSSSSSSSLFCDSSANSVASASAPILLVDKSSSSSTSHNQITCDHRLTSNRAQSQTKHNWFRFVGSEKSPVWPPQTIHQHLNHHYDQNLQMLFDDNQTGPNNVATILQQADEPKQQDMVECHCPQQEVRLVEAVLRAERWRQQPANNHQHDEQQQCSSEQHHQQPSIMSLLSVHLVKQLFLAFSLRHSISIIFQSTTGSSSGRQDHALHRSSSASDDNLTTQTAPSPAFGGRCYNSCGCNNCTTSGGLSGANKCGHRSRVSSLSSINESQMTFGCESATTVVGDYLIGHESTGEQPVVSETNRRRAGRKGEESIDSLHGLRFLSMIWVIAIHSYSFALRWMFFSNASQLEDVYKTAASQLLANGSFACDSFFFAAGFLLPYLAFPAYSKVESADSLGFAASASSQRQPAQAARQHHSQTTTRLMPNSSSSNSNNNNNNCSVKESKCKQQDSRSGCSSPDSHRLPQLDDNLSSSSSSPTSLSCYHSRQSATVSTCSTTGSNNSMVAPHHQQQRQQQQQQQLPFNNPKQTINMHKQLDEYLNTNEFTFSHLLSNLLHRYIRMMPLMMAIIGLSATLLRYLGEGPVWDDSTLMFDKWCRKNWWINALFLHNFVNRENMCLSHSWYSAVDIQLFILGQIILFVLFRNRKVGFIMCLVCLAASPLITGVLTLLHHLPAVPLISSVSEQSMNLYYGEIYIKPYCRASPYLIGILLAYLMRTTSLGQVRLKRWQATLGWCVSLATFASILLAMQQAMNGEPLGELPSALYSALSRPLWACATGWMIFACITKHGGLFATILSAKCFIPLSRLTYPAFLIHPIVMAIFYGSRQSAFPFSHYLMLYLILGNIVITYACAFILSILFELPLLSAERAIKRAWQEKKQQHQQQQRHHSSPSF